jgi:C_GCAxxG_C_C family probable redox protein
VKSEEAGKLFRTGFNCAQSVFLPFAKDYGLGEEDAARIASSFGAGMGRMQETCGAATGALMSIGLGYGFTKVEDQAQKDIVLAKTKEFLADFRKAFGSLRCKDLLGCDLNTAEGQKFHKDQNQREAICVKCVEHAASFVAGMAR